ncbi:glycine receptor subunit alpha-4-like isoform X2 [Convolutriloba macropyga]|uniref:glycine receptor subunit alpha-4-like isoform X2 n=1 Tax=Convolutriloba macropyga TaxID=536237 RepID=UPI003F51BBCF
MKVVYWFCEVAITFLWLSCIKTEESELLGEIIKSAIHPNLSKYDSKRVPCAPTPLNISVNIFIESLRDITSQCTIDFYLRQFWVDCFIANSVNSKSTVQTDDSFDMNQALHPADFTSFNSQEQTVWLPDSYFYQVRESEFGLGQMQHFIRVDSFGGVLLSQKVKLVTPCVINVAYFPFDVTHCTIMIASYGHTDASLVYSWDEKGVALFRENLDDNGFHYLYAHLTTKTGVFDTGNFSTIEARLFFERRYKVFFVQVYIPAALIVLLSWIGFYIQRNATPARASIGITTVLTMLTLASESSNKYDKNISNTINAINIYVWVCFAFVILAMVEFALADYFNKPRYNKTNKQRKDSTAATQGSANDNNRKESLSNSSSSNSNNSTALKLSTVGSVYSNPSSITRRPKTGAAATGFLSDNSAPRVYFNTGVTKGRNNATTLFPSTPVVNEVLPEGEPLNGTTPRGGTPRTPSSRTQFGRKLTIASIAHSLREIKETEVPRTVDKVSRYLFPIAFLIFNVLYATYYAISIQIYRTRLGEDIMAGVNNSDSQTE